MKVKITVKKWAKPLIWLTILITRGRVQEEIASAIIKIGVRYDLVD